jgi:hypothetical protein
MNATPHDQATRASGKELRGPKTKTNEQFRYQTHT